MKTTKTFLFLIPLFFLYSCFHCINLFFEKNETFWTDIYQKNDILVFSSQNEKDVKYDTIFIINKNIYKPKGDCNPIEVSNYDVESCVIDYKFKHDTLLSDCDYFIQHVKEKDGPSIPTFRVYGLEYSGTDLKDTTIVLNNPKKKLVDCYTFNKKDCYDGWSKYKIKTFVWSKKMGLVMFVGENGDKYELIKKYNAKSH